LSSTHTDTVAASPLLGDLLHGNGTPAWTKLAGNTSTTKEFLTQTGTGSVSAAPAWGAIASGDLPSHSHAASDVTSGQLALGRGGTNQSSWTAGRCVQVSSGGTALESAAAACGTGGGGSGVALLSWQKKGSAVAMDGTDKALASYTTSAGLLAAGQCLRVSETFFKTGTTAGVSVKFQVSDGSTTATASVGTIGAGNANVRYGHYWLFCNDSGSTTGNQLTGFPSSFNTPAEQTTALSTAANAITVSLLANGTASDTATGASFMVEHLK
jgi:hypothetical protein